MWDELMKDVGLSMSWGDKALGTAKAPAWVVALVGYAVYGHMDKVLPYVQKLIHSVVGG